MLNLELQNSVHAQSGGGGEVFTASDLDLLQEAQGEVPPHLLSAVESLRLLIEDTSERCFTFVSGSQTARLTRGVLRLLFKAADFAQADYLVEEQDKIEHLSGELSAFLRLRSETAQAPIVSGETLGDNSDEGRPTPEFFAQCLAALQGIAEFAEDVDKGRELDVFTDGERIVSMRRAFELGPEALEVVTSAFEETRMEAARRTQQELHTIIGQLPAGVQNEGGNN